MYMRVAGAGAGPGGGAGGGGGGGAGGGGVGVPQLSIRVQGWPLPAGPLFVDGFWPWFHQLAL